MQHSPGMRRQQVRDHWSDEAMYSNTPLRTQLAVEIQTARGRIGMDLDEHPFVVVCEQTNQTVARFSNLACAAKTAAHLKHLTRASYRVDNLQTGQVYEPDVCLHLAEQSVRPGGRS